MEASFCWETLKLKGAFTGNDQKLINETCSDLYKSHLMNEYI
jgi:hypothetical protein